MILRLYNPSIEVIEMGKYDKSIFACLILFLYPIRYTHSQIQNSPNPKRSIMKTTLIASIIAIILLPLQAQDITNKLGGTTDEVKYDVTDSADKVLLRVQGDGGVGIGTDTPDANLDVHGTVKAFGSWDYITYVDHSYYQAATDGYVTASFRNNGGGDIAIAGKTDPTLPPTTTRITDVILNPGDIAWVSITMPVRKGDWWTVSGEGTIVTETIIYWIPLGQ